MATRVGSTKDAATRTFIAVYGAAGVGKTKLLESLNSHAIEHHGAAIQIDFDDGNLSIRDAGLPSIGCDYIKDAYDALGWILNDPNWSKFTHIMIDGGTALAKSLLAQHLQGTAHAMQAYGKMAEDYLTFITYIKQNFRDKIIVMTFQETLLTDGAQQLLHGIDLPGRQLGPEMPYRFDEVLCLRIINNAEGQPERMLQSQPDMQYSAKDRSGKLEQFEPADLQHVINQITAV